MHYIATIALNLSTALYFFLFLPQIIHNFTKKRIQQISLLFHYLLMMAASADLYYGLGRIEQWQYPLVSVVTFLTLITQHGHLCTVYWHHKKERRALLLLSAIIAFLCIGLVISLKTLPPHHGLYLFMGWVERICYLLYLLPQIIKNHSINNSLALSHHFLILTLITGCCDGIAAWTFHWGPSSLWGTPLAIVIHSFCLIQYYQLSRTQLKQHA